MHLEIFREKAGIPQKIRAKGLPKRYKQKAFSCFLSFLFPKEKPSLGIPKALPNEIWIVLLPKTPQRNRAKAGIRRISSKSRLGLHNAGTRTQRVFAEKSLL
jgi:hypothetical protein